MKIKRYFFAGLFLISNAAAAMAAVGEAPLVESGTISASCAPWDGAAFTVTLQSNIKADVYASLDAIEKSGTSATFQAAENASKENDAIIYKCDVHGKNCKQHEGSVAITTVLGDTVTGTIQFPGLGWGRGVGNVENHMFRVKYDRTPAKCG